MGCLKNAFQKTGFVKDTRLNETVGQANLIIKDGAVNV